MKRSVAVRCVAPLRRDALEEVARLVLSFITVSTRPDSPGFRFSEDLELHLSAAALVDGCHLPDTAQDLLDAVEAFGIPIRKVDNRSRVAGQEWQEWWDGLDMVDPNREFDIELEIL